MPKAELKPAEAARMLGVFLPAYNALHRTDFTFDEVATKANEDASGSNRDEAVDYICTDETGERLLLQHTETSLVRKEVNPQVRRKKRQKSDRPSDDTRERTWPRNVRWLREALREQVAQMPGAPYIVGLGVHEPPTSPVEAREVVHVLAAEILARLHFLDQGKPVEWRPNNRVGKYVGEMSLERPGQPNLDGFSPGYAQAMQRAVNDSLARSPRKPGDTKVIVGDYIAHHDPVGQRALIALENKRGHYSSGKGLVLVIHYRITSYDEEDLPEIIRAIESAGGDFREVWVVSDWSMDRGLAHRVWTPTGRSRLRRQTCRGRGR